MKINTKYHGTVEYRDDEVILFNKGIPGFEDLRKYIMFSVEGNEVFNVLHSIEDKGVGFVIVSPFGLVKDYELKLDENLIHKLKIETQQDVLVMNTVTLNSKVENMTVNLKAPIIINLKERLGEQIILENDKYEIKHPLIKG